MGSNVEEASRAKAFAEKQFLDKNFVGAQKYALRAQKLCQGLEGISQMVATFRVYAASEVTINGERDLYSILGVDSTVEKSKLKRQYKKMAVLLHPDKNKTVGADGAFRLVSEAWTLLSDGAQRSAYDQRRISPAGYSDTSKFPSTHARLDTFWTVCTSCHVQYEYLRKYVNKRLSCKNCRGVFVAVETGLAPPSGTFQYNYSYPPENGYGSHGCGVTYIPPPTGYGAPNVASGHHTGYRSEYVSNISFQGNSSGVGLSDPSGLSSSSFVFYPANGEANQTKANGKHQQVKAAAHVGSNGCSGQNELAKSKRGRPSKKRKVLLGSSYANGHEEVCVNTPLEPKTVNVNGISKPAAKLPSAPAIDVRQLLIVQARAEILKKLEEMKLATEAAAAEAKKRKALADKQPELKRTVSITVPDSDFHDFDQDRSEECFKRKQIWALYDEEDGMPRLYCIIREIISLKPFKIHISYLSSKTDTEFGSVNWLDSGFTKSCGSFRVFHSETVEQVNIFSHLLARDKAGREGCWDLDPAATPEELLQGESAPLNNTTPDQIGKTSEVQKEQNLAKEKVSPSEVCQWQGKSEDDATWVETSELLSQFPNFNLEDKVVWKGGGIVRDVVYRRRMRKNGIKDMASSLEASDVEGT